MSAIDERILSAWAIIARAHRIGPSPANAERIARVVEHAAVVRDEAIVLRDEVMTDRDAQRVRAEAAEAEVARLRAQVAQYEADARDAAGELLVAIPTPGTDAARVMVASRIMRGQRDALADAARLRAIVEGRTIAPSDAEIAAHAAAGGWWLLHSLGSHPGASSLAALALDAEQAQRAARVQRDRGEGAHRWHAMLDGRPCPWPVAP